MILQRVEWQSSRLDCWKHVWWWEPPAISFGMYTKYLYFYTHITAGSIIKYDQGSNELECVCAHSTLALNVLRNAKYPHVVQLHQQSKLNDPPLLEAEVLQVHAPPFVSKETNSNQSIGPAFSRVQRRRSFIKKANPKPSLKQMSMSSRVTLG